MLQFPDNSHQVSCQWLAQNHADPRLVILDASMDNPVNKSDQTESGIIKNAVRFDFSNDIVDKDASAPNTMPNKAIFQQKVQALGINNDSLVVVYDKQGLFSAARAWFMFKSMGFNTVAILKGGFPAWRAAGQSSTDEYQAVKQQGNFTVLQNHNLFVDKQYVLNAINNERSQLVDARGYGRFSGQESEPRAGMRSGHIPNSLNLHYASLLEDGQLFSKEKLETIFAELVPSPDEFIFSCGSGVTACILALAADIAGFKNLKVYDGSWSEWGKDKLLPIDTIKS